MLELGRNTRTPAACTAVLAGLLLLGLGAGSARAIPLTLTTAGTIDSGSDSSGVFGAATANLAGKPYQLTLRFADYGSYQFTSPSDSIASGPIAGTVTATVGALSFTVPLVNSYGAVLQETPNAIYGFNVGDDNAFEIVTATNNLTTAANAFTPDLTRGLFYASTAADRPGNAGLVQFSASGPLGTASFFATPSSVLFSVPEPSSLALAAGALGAAWLLRRRAA